ncbi:(trans)glycosidase-4 [Coleophoma cylindrospora]|uniref:(Trans)glycosidase-4 n=1 Tax=Coleophoma cylindrospora TaxID=1849047 RepID=A0A3D8R1T5_9HELO|nr:(trans)glycosidase-4 [Coleophoma cylindrospora]
MAPLRLTIEKGEFRDSQGRHVTLRGINMAADAKYPSKPDQPSHIADDFFDGDNVDFHQRPFAVDEAHIHFSRLKRWGYNTIRYIFTWEAIEWAGPGKYDEEWIRHTIELLRLARDYGFYIFMDPHQDVWSRFSGGSGAPMWTLYACGLNPQGFAATEAALVHNTYPDPATFPKMIWSTNYARMANQLIWTMFYAGRDFTPKCIIDGKNIQDYINDHFIAAMGHLARRMHEAGDLEDDIVIGWETLNEPNRGLIGHQDISKIPPEQQLQKGTSPTAWQAILTGSGRACEIDTWDFGGLGPYKSGRVLVDPQGVSAWLPADYDDSRYGWKRDPGWKLGECVWAQHGVWDPKTDTLLKKDYFSCIPSTGEKLDYEEFTNKYFMAHYRKYRDTIRKWHKDCILFCQPPVLEIPPSIKGTVDDDPKMVYAPHYYDGITLITKKWNRYWNVDVFGVLRGRYMSPAFAVKLGETAIRNCFKDQLTAIRKEGEKYMGLHPCVMTEFGIPYDMDDKYAYKTGDYSSQSAAMDANHFAAEGSGMAGYTLWVYMCQNNHQRGDQWNGEDLSIFSTDDRPLPLSPLPPSPTNVSSASLIPNARSPGKKEFSDEATVTPGNLKKSLRTPSISSEQSNTPPELTNAPGFRAAEAYVRPSPIATVGKLVESGFDLRNCVFTMKLFAAKSGVEDTPTEIFLPEFHFPKDKCEVEVTSGKWSISTDDSDGGIIQKLRWWHVEGEHSIKITGVQRRQNMALGKEEEEGYLDQCQQTKCSIM